MRPDGDYAGFAGSPPSRRTIRSCQHEAGVQATFEAADGFLGGLAFGAFAGDVVLGLGVAAQAGDGDAVDGGVDLAVAAAVEAVSVGVAGADRDRSDARGAGELGVAGKAAGAGDLAN